MVYLQLLHRALSDLRREGDAGKDKDKNITVEKAVVRYMGSSFSLSWLGMMVSRYVVVNYGWLCQNWHFFHDIINLI